MRPLHPLLSALLLLTACQAGTLEQAKNSDKAIKETPVQQAERAASVGSPRFVEMNEIKAAGDKYKYSVIAYANAGKEITAYRNEPIRITLGNLETGPGTTEFVVRYGSNTLAAPAGESCTTLKPAPNDAKSSVLFACRYPLTIEYVYFLPQDQGVYDLTVCESRSSGSFNCDRTIFSNTLAVRRR